MLLSPPGVYRAEGDTELLTQVMRAGGYAVGRHVLDLGTGSGALAIAAARAGAATVTAVDLSRRSAAVAWFNSRLNGAAVSVRRGDLVAPVLGRRFGLVVSNPPYVPAQTDVLPRHRKARCWDAGRDGRAVVDRICAEVGAVLAPKGTLLLVHSALCDPAATVTALRRTGLTADVLARSEVPFGPVLRSRAAMLRERGLLQEDQLVEELVVVGAHRS